MSALPDALPRFRLMKLDDLGVVEDIERAVYTHPWTRGNFIDSMDAGYHCWILSCAGNIAGYAVVMIAAGEAHLLNLSVAPAMQRQGLGSALLRFVIKLAADYDALSMFLEVRASNIAALALYAGHGFCKIGVRNGYYPACEGREDAVTMELKLS